MLLLSTYSYSEPDVEPLETNTGSDSASYIRSVLMLFLTLSLQVDASNWVLESSRISATTIIEVGFAQAATTLRELFSWRSGGGYPFTLHKRILVSTDKNALICAIKPSITPSDVVPTLSGMQSRSWQSRMQGEHDLKSDIPLAFVFRQTCLCACRCKNRTPSYLNVAFTPLYSRGFSSRKNVGARVSCFFCFV